MAKAEHLAKGANPRFIVTSLSLEDRGARPLYEEDYCGRGEMENRINEQQLHLFADRTSAQTMRANQVRRSRSHHRGCQIRMRRVFSSHGTDAPAPRTVMEGGLA